MIQGHAVAEAQNVEAAGEKQKRPINELNKWETNKIRKRMILGYLTTSERTAAMK